MDELQKQVSKALNELVQSLMDKIKEAKVEGLDLADFVKELSSTQDRLSTSFIDAKLRNKKTKKGLF